MDGAALIQTETPVDVDKPRATEEKPRGGFTSETARLHGQQPGQPSRNPKGRPKGVRYLSEAFRFWLAAANELNPGATNADEIAAIVGAAALSGDLKACELLLTRTEGKPREWPKYRTDLGEDSQRLNVEQEIYYRMEDEGLDYAEVVERMGEEERAEIEEDLREQKREARAHRAALKLAAEKFAQAEADRKAREAEAVKAPEPRQAEPDEKLPKTTIPAPEQPANWMDKYRSRPEAQPEPEPEAAADPWVALSAEMLALFGGEGKAKA